MGSGRRTCSFDAEELDLSGMGLDCIPPELARCGNLRTLHIGRNRISRLENLPAGLRVLNAWANRISELEGLPAGLAVLNLSFNDISRLEGLPAGLVALDVKYNHLRSLHGLPRGLHTLDARWNEIDDLQGLPPYLEEIRVISRDPLVREINSGSRASRQRAADRWEVALF